MRPEYRVSWRLLRQEARRGELSIMVLAIALAVAAVFTLAALSERLQSGLLLQSGEFLAADRILSSNQPLPQEWLAQAEQQQLTTAERITLSSMAFAHEQLALVNIKAVTATYPLRGTLTLATNASSTSNTATLPQQGEVWVDAALLQQLALEKGDRLELGSRQFIVSEFILKEPDTGLNLFHDHPTVLMNISDLASTELIQPGSRLQYQFLFAGTAADISPFERWLLPQLDPLNQRWQSVRDGQSALTIALHRAEQFMLLASLLGVVLAATAVAVAAQQYCQRHYDTVAIMKALGAKRPFIWQVFISHLILLSVFSMGLGLLLGFFLQAIIVQLIQWQFSYQLPAASLAPIWLAVTTGLFTAALFSLYPLARLMAVPPLRVLRRSLVAQQSWGKAVHVGISFFALYGLMYLYSGSALLSLLLLASGTFAALALLAIGHLLIRFSRQVGLHAGSSWRLAMANLQRRAQANSIQMLSFSLALMLLMLMLVLRNELLDEWQQQLPADTPNYFMLNVSEQQRAPLTDLFQQEGIVSSGFYPITPGRLLAVNGEAVQDGNSPQPSQRQGFGRELQLTWQADLPVGNKLIAGQWWQTQADGRFSLGVSVEAQAAKRLAIEVGDVLQFKVGAEEFSVPVTSLREVNWNSLQPNFYMIFSPSVLDNAVMTYMAGLHLPAAQQQQKYELLRDFPQVILIDLDSILQQIRTIIAQIGLAISFIMLLVIFAGILVFSAQVQASFMERKQELVILRTLGAPSRLLVQAVLYEFMVLGALAGLIAALAMEISLYVVQTQVFQLTVSWHWRFWLIGPALGAVAVLALGWSATRPLVKQNTATLIRGLNRV